MKKKNSAENFLIQMPLTEKSIIYFFDMNR